MRVLRLLAALVRNDRVINQRQNRAETWSFAAPPMTQVPQLVSRFGLGLRPKSLMDASSSYFFSYSPGINLDQYDEKDASKYIGIDSVESELLHHLQTRMARIPSV
jgi:hypothetical protein